MSKKYILGLAIIAVAFSYLIWVSFRKSFQFALSPSELSTRQSDLVKVFGTVADGSILVAGTDYNFKLTDGKKTIAVHYKGLVPNTFREGAEVVASGRIDPATGIFEAKQLITKCASKYEVK